jgi:hypothetical protein
MVIFNDTLAKLKEREDIFSGAKHQFTKAEEQFKSRSTLYVDNNPKFRSDYEEAKKSFKVVEAACGSAVKDLLSGVNYWEVFGLFYDENKRKHGNKRSLTYMVETKFPAFFPTFRVSKYKGEEKLQFLLAIIFIIIYEVDILTAEIWLSKAGFAFRDCEDADAAVREKIANHRHSFINSIELQAIKERGLSGYVTEF